MEDKITIERDVFKALASDTRIEILKLLDKRRHTQSEIAFSLKLSVPTVKEHLDAMGKAGLVKQIDEGYKWKYYELTEKSRCILDPERKKVWILLGLWIIGAIGTAAVFSRNIFSSAVSNTQMLAAAPSAEGDMLAKSVPEAVQIAAKPFPYLESAIVALLVILTILLVYFLVKSRILKKHK